MNDSPFNRTFHGDDTDDQPERAAAVTTLLKQIFPFELSWHLADKPDARLTVIGCTDPRETPHRCGMPMAGSLVAQRGLESFYREFRLGENAEAARWAKQIVDVILPNRFFYFLNKLSLSFTSRPETSTHCR